MSDILASDRDAGIFRAYGSVDVVPATAKQLRVLAKRREYLLDREADPQTRPTVLNYVREERSAIEAVLNELGQLRVRQEASRGSLK